MWSPVWTWSQDRPSAAVTWPGWTACGIDLLTKVNGLTRKLLTLHLCTSPALYHVYTSRCCACKPTPVPIQIHAPRHKHYVQERRVWACCKHAQNRKSFNKLLNLIFGMNFDNLNNNNNNNNNNKPWFRLWYRWSVSMLALCAVQWLMAEDTTATDIDASAGQQHHWLGYCKKKLQLDDDGKLSRPSTNHTLQAAHSIHTNWDSLSIDLYTRSEPWVQTAQYASL